MSVSETLAFFNYRFPEQIMTWQLMPYIVGSQCEVFESGTMRIFASAPEATQLGLELLAARCCSRCRTAWHVVDKWVVDLWHGQFSSLACNHMNSASTST